ncbi:hypothetical protein Pcinc_018150 [Petrolisthes cinctipes]|uniref:Uncharacterized protein n=1 Tax=Petrolisthes cinctipes TaxID=88211 RepID=A0AAE1FPA5_PETCI|nr:hypothetical protein Pcinc_018150 [Petrolisthes cinctipes]
MTLQPDSLLVDSWRTGFIWLWNGEGPNLVCYCLMTIAMMTALLVSLACITDVNDIFNQSPTRPVQLKPKLRQLFLGGWLASSLLSSASAATPSSLLHNTSCCVLFRLVVVALGLKVTFKPHHNVLGDLGLTTTAQGGEFEAALCLCSVVYCVP